MKKSTKAILSISLTIAMTFASVMPAMADTEIPKVVPKTTAIDVRTVSAAKVFDTKTVNGLQKQVKSKLVLKRDKADEDVDDRNVSAIGTYPTRKGVILVTADAYKNLIPTGHAGIIYTASTVVESLSNGVTTGSNDWNRTKKTCYGITVSGTSATQDSSAANYCYNRIGYPYNFNYFNSATRSKFYCSQLVYAAYKDLFGINLDTSTFGAAVHPMELVNSSKTYTIFSK